MRVIREGNYGKPIKDKIYKGTCPYCKSMLEVNEHEFKSLHVLNDHKGVFCPICNSAIRRNNFELSNCISVTKLLIFILIVILLFIFNTMYYRFVLGC